MKTGLGAFQITAYGCGHDLRNNPALERFMASVSTEDLLRTLPTEESWRGRQVNARICCQVTKFGSYNDRKLHVANNNT